MGANAPPFVLEERHPLWQVTALKHLPAAATTIEPIAGGAKSIADLKTGDNVEFRVKMGRRQPDDHGDQTGGKGEEVREPMAGSSTTAAGDRVARA